MDTLKNFKRTNYCGSPRMSDVGKNSLCMRLGTAPERPGRSDLR